MSDEQQQAAIGRTVEEYAACKKRLATLQATATQIATVLSRMGQYLSAFAKNPAIQSASFQTELNSNAVNFPTIESLRELWSDIATDDRRKTELYAILKNMGFTPAD